MRLSRIGIFPKYGMHLGDNKAKKIAEPFLRKTFILSKLAKRAENGSFCYFAKLVHAQRILRRI